MSATGISFSNVCDTNSYQFLPDSSVVLCLAEVKSRLNHFLTMHHFSYANTVIAVIGMSVHPSVLHFCLELPSIGSKISYLR